MELLNLKKHYYKKELQEQKINSQQRKKEGLGWKELLLRTIGIIDTRRI